MPVTASMPWPVMSPTTISRSSSGSGQHVVPVAADQVPRLDRAVADRHVHPGGGHRRLVLRHDGPLQAERELVLLGRALLAVGQLVAGGGQRDLGVVLHRDVLEGAAQRDQRVVDDDRLGEDPDLPDRRGARPDDAEHRHGGLPALQQRLLEPADRRAVGRDHEAVQLGDRDRRRLRGVEPEQRERDRRVQRMVPAASCSSQPPMLPSRCAWPSSSATCSASPGVRQVKSTPAKNGTRVRSAITGCPHRRRSRRPHRRSAGR